MMHEAQPIHPEKRTNIIHSVTRTPDVQKRVSQELSSLTSRGALLPAIHRLSTDIYFSSTQPAFAATRDAIHSTISSENKPRDEKLRDAITVHRYEKVSSDSPEYSALMSAVSLEQQVERDLLRTVVQGENKLHFTPLDTELILTLCDMQDQIDVVYRLFHNDTVASPFAKELVARGENAVKMELEQQGLLTDDTEYLYVTFDKGPHGEIIPKTYMQKYGEPMQKIVDRMDSFLAYLQQAGDEIDNGTGGKLRTFFDAWRRVLTIDSFDPVVNDQLGEKLDEAWRGLPDSIPVLPYPGFEAYSDFLGMRPDPEIILAMKDERYPEIEQDAAMVKDRMITTLGNRYGETQSLQGSLDALQKTTVTFRTFQDAGAGLTHTIGGSNLPNRDIVRLAMGARITDLVESAYETWPTYHQKVVQLLGEQEASRLYPDTDQTVRADVIYLAAGHEVGHSGFEQVDTRVRLGTENHQQMDECKADLAIFSTMPEVTQGNIDEQRVFLRMLLSRGLIVLGRVDNEGSRPYYNSGLVFMRAMTDSGLLTKTQGQWHYSDAHEEIMNDFFGKLHIAFDDLVTVYDKKDPELAREYRRTYFQESPAVLDILKTLGVVTDNTNSHLAINRKV